MRASMALAAIMASTTCLFAFVTPAVAQVQSFNVPAGDLKAAIATYIRQTGVQVVYRDADLARSHTSGIAGVMSPDDALQLLLADSGFEAKRDASGAFAIVRVRKPAIKKSSYTRFAEAKGQVAVPSADPERPEPTVSDDEIIVTARKREETFIDVPVVMTALGGTQLKNQGVTDLDGISRAVPQLQIGTSSGGVQGGVIVLRGIQGPSSNPQGDQAVSFNVDGVQIAKSSIRRLGTFDLQSVEVLKGPQALFYGKNSPGGVITMRTADPTNEFKASISAGYEFEAHEFRTEGYVSGPITDTLGLRLAGYYSRYRGSVKEITPDTSILAPSHGYSPRERSFAVRGTLKFEPSDRLSMRAKLSYGEYRVNGLAASYQIIDCLNGPGVSNYGSPDTCKPDRTTYAPGYGTYLATQRPGFRADGDPDAKQTQLLAGIEISYDLTDAINLTSITGLYRTRYDNAANFTPTYLFRALPATQKLNNREFSEEIRLNTDYDGPLNFTAGLYLADTKSFNSGNALFFNPATPTTVIQINMNEIYHKGSTISGFAQLRWKPVESVEISGGARYSKEKKNLPTVYFVGGGLVSNANLLDRDNPAHLVVPGVAKKSWTDWSPEATVSWKPNENLNVFASYKHGFLSGGFNTSNTPYFNGVDTSYDPEKVKGFEAGLKSYLFDRTLQLNLAAYTYKVIGLQVANFINAQSFLTNAAGVKVKGIEADFTYRTPLEGLKLRSAAAYNKGRYTDYQTAPCYQPQTNQQGCDIGGTGAQDLSGTELINAPKWNLSGGFDYETPVGASLKLGLSGGLTYSSSYLTENNSNPRGRMPNYTLIDGTVRISDSDDRWELALIGRNLSDRFIWTQSSTATFSGGDVAAAVGRGREVMLRATYNY